MSVFFSFGNTQLTPTLLGDVFAEGVRQIHSFHRIREGKCFVVFGQGCKVDGRALPLGRKFGKIRFRKSPGDLPGSVRAEVEEEHHIAVFNGCHRFSYRIGDHCRYDKLVGLCAVVCGLHSGRTAGRR